MRADQAKITVLSGGVGAARFLRGLIDIVPDASISAIVNVADDVSLHGLWVSPDLDTVMYTLADAIDQDRGWGLRDETWQAMESLGRYGTRNWFSLGDRDLATHLERTAMLSEGADLTEVTTALRKAWGVAVNILPVTNDAVSTKVTLADNNEEISFQEYFVGRQHDVPIESVRFDGIDAAHATEQALDALHSADVVIIAPSNPIVSIAPVLGVPGVLEALQASSATRVAISPIVAGEALKGPAAAMLKELGHDSDAVGVAQMWADVIDVLLIDDRDAALASRVAAHHVVPYVTDTVMANPTRRRSVARSALSAANLRINNPRHR